MKKALKRVLSHVLGGPLFYLLPSQRGNSVPSDEAKQKLASHSPDPGRSALCDHAWPAPEYDLTIIVPVYNAERYLERCLDSILNQKTKYRFHVVAINDGSTDGSEEILNHYRSCDQVRTIDQENGGISAARNAGLNEVKGRCIMFVDSDDFLPDHAVESLMRTAYEMDADIVQGSFCDTDEAGQAIWGTTHYNKCDNVPPNGQLAGMPWGKVYQADLFRRIQFPEDCWYEDTIVTALITHLAKNIVTIPDIVYYYRQNAAGITRTSKGKPKSVDTYWIHKNIMLDRKKLGMTTDCAFYEHLLRMAVLSYKRTENEPKEIQFCLLALWKELLGRERRSEFQLNPRYRNLEKTILEEDYGKYRILCKYCFW